MPHITVDPGLWNITFPVIGKLPDGPGGRHLGGFDLALTPTNDCDHNS